MTRTTKPPAWTSTPKAKPPGKKIGNTVLPISTPTLAALKKIERGVALSKMRFSPQGLQRWRAEAGAGGSRKRTP